MLKGLKTATQLNLSGFAQFVRDGDVRLALVRVTSENLKRVDLTFCGLWLYALEPLWVPRQRWTCLCVSDRWVRKAWSIRFRTLAVS